MNLKPLEHNISYATTVAILLAVSTRYFVILDGDLENFYKFVAQFYGITIVFLILSYILLQLFTYPDTFEKVINYIVLANIFTMSAVIIFVLLLGRIDTLKISTLIGYFMSANYILVSLSLACVISLGLIATIKDKESHKSIQENVEFTQKQLD